MFSPLRDPAPLAAPPIGAAGARSTGALGHDRGAPSDAGPAPFAGWRASLRRALDLTVAFTTLESYTADDLLRPLAGSADAAPGAGGPASRRAAGPLGLAARGGADASSLGAPSGPRRRPATSRPRRAHAAPPAGPRCTSPLPGGPRSPRATPSARHTPATVAARAGSPASAAAARGLG
jgi:hypothetical protein